MPISSLFDGWQTIKQTGHLSVFAIIGEEKSVVEYQTVKQKLDPSRRSLKKANFEKTGVDA